jgi:uncharacterized protein YkwD
VSPSTRRSRVLARGAAVPVVLAIALAASGTADAAGSSPARTAERAMATALTAERAAHHLAPLAAAADLTRVARTWAAQMAAAHEVAQNPDLQDEAGKWVSLGENVGMGPDAASIDKAFLTSPSHRANLLATDYTQVGIGAAVAADGTVFVVEDFRRPPSVAPAARPSPRQTPPAATATPSTRPATAASSPTRSAERPSATTLAATLRARLAALSRQRPAGSDPLARAAGFARALDALAAPTSSGG